MATLRPNWRQSYGPMNLSMPDDGVRAPIQWPADHEDHEDRINADGTHGPPEPYSPGGSGICMGHSVQEPENVVALDEACMKRIIPYDWEHHIRALRHSIARTEMVRDTQGPRHVLWHASRAKAYWDSPTISDDPGWRPDNINQYIHMAQSAPHTGSPVNGRALGWVMYGEAMALKVDPHRDPMFADKLLEFCNTAAMQYTGQVCSGPNTGGAATDPVNVAYCFHMGILVHGALALSYQRKQEVTWWCLCWMLSTLGLPVMAYYGVPSMPGFVYTQGERLKAATGPGVHADPAFGWHGSNCAAMKKLSGQPIWKDRASMFGPTTVTDEQSRKFTMLQRAI